MYGLELVTPPASEPVNLTTLKDHLRINLNDEDTILSLYLTAARQLFENLSGRQLMEATWKLYLDSWPKVIYLPKPPLKTLVSVKYYDANDQLQTLDPSAYTLDAKREPARIHVNDTWPTLTDTVRPKVVVEFQAGKTNAADVPEIVRQGIMLLAGTYYANRESLTEAKLEELPMGFRAIVDQYRVGFVSTMGME